MNTILIVILVLIIIIVIIYILLYLSRNHAGLFINWNNQKNWINEDLGHELLDISECKAIQDKVNKDITKRWVNSTLCTIGTAAYIDEHDYTRMVNLSNNYIYERYGKNLYENISKHLSNRLGHSCVYPYLKYRYSIALPGFHLFDRDSWLGKGWNVASLHTDQQEHKIEWPQHFEFDWNKTYSFTIPITTPKGAGLYMINKKNSHVNLSRPLWLELRNIKIEYIQYKKGHCYLHHGKWFHMIAPFDGKYGDRITIQGHAIYCKSLSEYWLYW